jgi:short-subunit dehydrogenase
MINKTLKKTIIITGASSGLGAELAIQYAKLKHRLFLTGRSLERLSEVASECLKHTNEVNIKTIDVTNKEALREWIYFISKHYVIDIVIANAGISAGSIGGYEETEQVYTIFDTNLYGVLNTILPNIEIMTKQNSGQIVIISSIASLLPLPGAPSYSTTKSAVRAFGDALRVELKKYNIKVNIVIPGFIKTPLTDKNNFPMPFLISSEKAAKKIIYGLDKNNAYIYFPKILFYLTKFISIFPRSLLDFLLAKLPQKGVLKEDI